MTIYDPTALRRELHEMPELALHEKRTSAYVAEKLKALGIETHENVGGSTGVVGIIRGTEPGPVFMLRADMDALPFVIDGKPCCIHACGHDGHTAMLLAAASRLKDKIKRGTLKLLFQPAEETLQGAPVIIKAGVIDDVDYALGAHIRPIQDVPAGMLCAAVRHTASTTLTIVIKGRGAHASRPHLGINAIEAAALFIVHAKKRLPELLAGNAAAGPASSSIDLVSGGAAENVVPASASVTIDFRYQGVESAQVQCDRIEKILCEVRTDPDFPPVSTSLTVTGDWTLARSRRSFTFRFCLPQDTSATPSISSAAQRAILPMTSVEICRLPPLRSMFCKSILWPSIQNERMPILFYAFHAKRASLCKTFDVIIPFSPVLYNTLLHFHHSNILRSHLALAEHDVPYLGHLCRRQRVAGGHHGQVSPTGL